MKSEKRLFLIATTLSSCVLLLLFYNLWGYLEASVKVPVQTSSGIVKYFSKLFPAQTVSFVSKADQKVPYRGFIPAEFTKDGSSLAYYLVMPAHYNPAQKYPLVLVLQGGGERSNPAISPIKNEKVLLDDSYAQVWSSAYSGAGNPHIQQNWPSFVVIPQITLSQQWVNVDVHKGSYTQPSQPGKSLLLAKELLDALQQQYTSIDASRLYLTGLSNGGFGVWDAVERWPDYFAAAVPIAGAGDPSKASVLKDLPIWAFHGTSDKTVPVAGSRAMIAAIKAAGGHPRYMEFTHASHEVWLYVYSLQSSSLDLTDFFPWLFSQHK